MNRIVFLCLVFALALDLRATEGHVDAVIADIRANVLRLRAADSEVVPFAFWDFDGTIIKGDVSIGLVEDGKTCYRGLLEEVLSAGWVPIYQGPDAYRTWQKDYARMTEIGSWLAQSFDAQMFGEVSSSALDAFCQAKIRENGYEKWYFASSVAIWKALDEMGVRNFVISANMEALVRNLAPTLDIPRDRVRGCRTDEVGGLWTRRIQYPVLVGEGKAEFVARVVGDCPHGVAIAGFGNSYSTDAAFLRYIATQKLPAGATPLAVMINGGIAPDAYKDVFRRVEQFEVLGDRR